MTTFIVTIHIIACFVLILVILLQAGRGSGLSWGSFGGTPDSLLGTRSASFLAKATSVCAILFLVTCITLNVIEARKSKSLFSGVPQEKVDVEKIKKILEQTKAGIPETGANDAAHQANETTPISPETPPPPAVEAAKAAE